MTGHVHHPTVCCTVSACPSMTEESCEAGTSGGHRESCEISTVSRRVMSEWERLQTEEAGNGAEVCWRDQSLMANQGHHKVALQSL